MKHFALAALLALTACTPEPVATLHPSIAALPDDTRREFLEGLRPPIDGQMVTTHMTLVRSFDTGEREEIEAHIAANWPAYVAAREAIPRTALDESLRSFDAAVEELSQRVADEDMLAPATDGMQTLLGTHLPHDLRLDMASTKDRAASDRVWTSTITALYTAAPDELLDFAEFQLGMRETRRWTDADNARLLFDIFVTQGRSSRARTIAARYSEASADWGDVPDAVDLPKGRKRVVAIAEDGTLTPQTLKLGGFTGLIGLGSPYCAPCTRSNAWMSANPDALAGVDAIWLEGLAREGDARVADYNAENPDFALRFPGPRAQWPEINFWGAPSFYIFQDGAVVGKVVGWADDEQGAKLSAHLDGIRN